MIFLTPLKSSTYSNDLGFWPQPSFPQSCPETLPDRALRPLPGLTAPLPAATSPAHSPMGLPAAIALPSPHRAWSPSSPQLFCCLSLQVPDKTSWVPSSSLPRSFLSARQLGLYPASPTGATLAKATGGFHAIQSSGRSSVLTRP